MFFIYSFYLYKAQEKELLFQCAPITRDVAERTVSVLNYIGYNAEIQQHDQELSFKLILDELYIARIIEGCNSLSVIILFIAFIVAFPGNIKKTILYAMFGSLLIYFVNILRIVFLSVALAKFPNEKELLHNLVFPLIIYGLVFLLWIVWVNYFSNYKEFRDAKNS